MGERNMIFREINFLEASGPGPGFEYQAAAPAAIPPATIGFEFDVNYGASFDAVPPAAVTQIECATITTHTTSADGFRLKGDGPRIEIATKPFTVDAAGKKEMLRVMGAVVKLTGEFTKAVKAAPLHPGTTGYPEAIGRPKAIQHPSLDSKIKWIFPIGAGSSKANPYYRSSGALGAAAQVTLALPLAKVADLVAEIKQSEGRNKEDFQLSGPSGYRQGLRSEALYQARQRVMASRRYHLRYKTVLPNGSKVTESNYTKDLEGLLILMVSYLVSGELKYKDRESDGTCKSCDYEPFAKAYLPLNVKHHFRELLHDLSAAEKAVFQGLYFDGVKQFNIFKLAKKDADVTFAKSARLFPARVTDWMFYFKKAPTWYEFVEMTAGNTALLRNVTPVEPCPKHAVGDETSFAPLTRSIPYVAGSKRVIVEMRRLGMRFIYNWEWEKLSLSMFKLAQKLN